MRMGVDDFHSDRASGTFRGRGDRPRSGASGATTSLSPKKPVRTPSRKMNFHFRKARASLVAIRRRCSVIWNRKFNRDMSPSAGVE